jgi:hypothetical protein
MLVQMVPRTANHGTGSGSTSLDPGRRHLLALDRAYDSGVSRPVADTALPVSRELARKEERRCRIAASEPDWNVARTERPYRDIVPTGTELALRNDAHVLLWISIVELHAS